MAYRDILVHLRASGSTEAATLAVNIAKRFGGHLTGLYALPDVAMFKLMLGQSSSHVREVERADYARAGEAERAFRALAAQAGIDVEWQVGEGDVAELLCIAARLKDLVVVGQTEPGDPGRGVAETVVVTADRPTIVVPSAGRFETVGRRILIGWNGSREAALAVKAAEPLFADAEQVTVLMGKSRETFNALTRVPPVDVEAYLKRRGVTPELRPFDVSDLESGAALLDMARQTEADLLVMGAFGRSWLREWVLGGATRHVFRSMPIPVLMAH